MSIGSAARWSSSPARGPPTTLSRARSRRRDESRGFGAQKAGRRGQAGHGGRALFETVLYVYAITDSVHPPARVGLRGASPRVIGEQAPLAVVSDHENLPSQPSEEDLWRHESVVEELMERSTVLPMRFGTN